MRRFIAASFAVTVAGLGALSSVGGCVALVPEPVELESCNNDNDCPNGMQCAVLGKATTTAAEQYLCVAATCRKGLSCAPGCNCQCNDCKENEFCDISMNHLAMDNGSLCVAAKCLMPGKDEFQCGEAGCLGC